MKSFLIPLMVLAVSGAASGALVIYEPFADTNSTITGNTAGTGLSGNWAGSGAVVGSTINYGNLQTGSGGAASISNTNGYVSTGTSLSSAGLLNDGATLWFSFVVTTGGDVATNGDLGFAFGTDQIGTGNNIPVANSGTAFGVRFKNNQLRAALWTPGALAHQAGSSISASTTYLVAGKFTWGAGATDKLEVYKVDTNLNMTLSSTYSAVDVNQSLFDTVSFGSKAATPAHFFDEIRFGATSADVLPSSVPEPTSAFLGSIGCLLLLRRRKR